MEIKRCDLLIVEPSVNDYGHTIIHRVNVVNGDYLIPRVIDSDKTIVSQLLELVDIIKEDRPDKVIFVKAGIGHAFYDTFIFLMNQRVNMSIDGFGTMYYHNSKENENGKKESITD